MRMPSDASARTDDSRPGPGPLMRTSRFLMPCSCAARPAVSAATCAANGVDLREPLKPWPPDDAHAKALPWRSVIVMIVLLNDACTCATPSATFLRTFLLTRRAAVLTGGLAICSVPRMLGGSGLLQRGGALLRALARARVGAGALAAHRQAAAMAHAAIGAQVHQALDVDRDLAAQVALDRQARDLLADLLELLVGEVLDLLGIGDAHRVADLLRGRTADAVDRGQADLGVLVHWNVDAGDACHGGPSISLDVACGAGRCRSRERRPCAG